ncbi:MAG TPA: polysaccharide deacetylase family protein [Abditibacteriaceae bacterium]|jgi:peptidoglycan/xylan/chitin deacetylase (PgdA/CDA1 family)
MNLLFSEKTLRRRRLGRAAGFAFVTALVWGGYYMWRPPAPMLGLKRMTHLPEASGEVSLTFDDAPHPLTTPLLLAALRRADVKASFFVVGDGLRLYPQLAHDIAKEKHRLANHSQYHNNLTRISRGDYDHEVAACFAAIEREGQKTRLFRPPGGGLDRDLMDYLHRKNVTLAWWSHNPGDWARPPAWKLADQAKARLRGGDILLLHDAGIGTPQALFSIARAARKQGLTFVPMPEAIKTEF